MKNAQNVTLALLAAAAILLAGLLFLSRLPGEPAYAGGCGIKDGDYVFIAANYDQDTDLVYVIDIDTNRLNLYTVDINTRTIRMGDTADLSRVFRGGAGR